MQDDETSIADGHESTVEMEPIERPENIVPRYFQEARHTEEIVGMLEDAEERNIWRKYGKERMKTVSVALCLCLHLGVDPPDREPRPKPCAKLEAWVDPTAGQTSKAMGKIAASLQKSYERWQPRARYKVAADPTMEEVRRVCIGMRRNARDERVLFHYNGHGVPKPTANGEIWVFNKNFTQYIPLSVFDLQSWMDSPSIYVWDCDAAEIIVNSFNRFAADHEKEWTTDLEEFQEKTDGIPPPLSHMTLDEQAEAVKFPKKRPRFKECIQLAACKAEQTLPHHPFLPADLFTSCLTTPIHTSILWYLIRTNRAHYFPNLIEDIPGVLTDRRTLLGELNWIFTAITDTMAWNALPRDVFQRLFRQDLLLASLFRSFLLAERVMSAYGCDVVSVPKLPSAAEHPLWEAWEYTIDLCISHLITQMNGDKNIICQLGRDYFARSQLMPLNTLLDFSTVTKMDLAMESQYNSFFIEQLRAFEVWLEYGVEKRKPPQQLPVVLQVLLSQVHRVRALELLARFLDHGQWAVGYALSVGIFPYVLKLLQSNTRELKPSLAFIWAKILAVDPGCQAELFKENGEESRMDSINARNREKKELRYFYFVKMLNDPNTPPRQKVVPAFVLATLFHNNYRTAQELLTDQGYVNLCTELLADPIASGSRLFKLWILIGLGRLWADYNSARWQAVRLVAYAKVEAELEDESPEVRAAAVYALGGLVKNRADKSEHALVMSQQLCDALCSKCTRDSAHIVREELLVALQYFVCDSSSSLANLHRRLRVQTSKMSMRVEEEVEVEILVETGVDEERMSIMSGGGSTRERMERSWLSARSDRLSISRRRNNPSESSVALDELIQSMSAAELSATSASSAARQTYSFNSEDVACREECIKMLSILESKNFADPTERIFIAVLRLVLDPIERVSRMARVLVRYIAQLSEMKEKLHQDIIYHVSAANQPGRQRAENASAAAASQRKLSSVDLPTTPARKRNAAGSGKNTVDGLIDAEEQQTAAADEEGNHVPTAIFDVLKREEQEQQQNGNAAAAAGEDEIDHAAPPAEVEILQRLQQEAEEEHAAGPSITINQQPSNKLHQRAKDDMDIGGGGGVTFTVGSPQPASLVLSTTPIENVGMFRNGNNMAATPSASSSNQLTTPLGPMRKLSAPPLTSTPKPPPQQVKVPRDPKENPFMNLNTFEFQPKRRMAEKREVGKRTHKNYEKETDLKPWEDLVETKFVPWCSRVFTEPILDLIQSEDVDCASEGVLTQANATDWALHYEEGLRQLGGDEFSKIREKPELMGEQRWYHKREYGNSTRRILYTVFSMLRPYVYCTDGDNIEMIQYESVQLGGMGMATSSSASSSTTSSNTSRMMLVNSFPVHAGNAFSVDKACWLEVMNSMSTEMLLSGSADGVVKVWDVHLNVHSHEMEKETSLISAAFPLADQSRMIEKSVRGVTTVYDWNQSSGSLLCSGNVKVCRVWDAHTERARLDIPTGRRSAVVSISADLDDNHMIALGFRDGAVHVHDTRVPSDQSRIAALAEHSRPIVGVSLRAESEARCLLSAASSDGLMCVWEPRMYKEPIVDVNVLDDSLGSSGRGGGASSFDSLGRPTTAASMLSMRMHDSAQILACALSTSTVRMYDVSGRAMCSLRPWGAAPLIKPTIASFHPRRALLSVAHMSTSGEACVSIFGPPEKGGTRGHREEKRDRLGRR